MELQEKYHKACELLKQKEYRKAQMYLEQVKKSQTDYRSVNYFLAKCLYQNNEPKEKIYPLLKTHLRKNTTKNRKASYKLALKVATKYDDLGVAHAFKTKAEAEGIELEKKTQTKERLLFKFIKLAKNKTPIAKTSAPKYRAYKFLINGLTATQKANFADGRWHEVAVKDLKFSGFKGYMTCLAYDDRKFYAKYLPRLPESHLRTSLNDFLEEDEFFKTKWERSRVFSLLQVPGFYRQQIEKSLRENGLLDDEAKKHLKGCLDLVYLKTAGEFLPISEKKNLSEYDLLVEFGYLCPKNCNKTIHLKNKCQYERDLNQILAKNTRKKLPLINSPTDFIPSAEQKDFIAWLTQSKRSVLNLLGVGGSGKTYTLGKILDKSKVLALAPTHKARLNLLENGFYNNDTLQHLIYELENRKDEFELDYEVILIDEISMATLEMLSKLLTAFGTTVRYILIGDEKQLPPVTKDEEALSVCGFPVELLKAYGACFYFQTNLRCQNKALGELIAACRKKDIEKLAQLPQFKMATGKEMVIYKYSHQELEECLIVAYHNRTVGLINQQFHRILSKDKTKVVPFYFQNGYGRGGFFVGAKVIFYHNDDSYQNYGYTNSETGEITGLELNKTDQTSKVYVKTGVNEYTLPLDRAKKDLLLAYAITIHKAQGSGANRVYVLEPLDHGLAYTAVSRAKVELFFVGTTRTEFLTGVKKMTQRKKNISINDE